MIALMQILRILSVEQRHGLREFFDNPEDGWGPEELADSVEAFLFAQFSVHVELTDLQRQMLARVIENKSYESAFNIVL